MTLDVRTMCLGALSEEKASGYELQKSFKEGPYAHFLDASYGSIYPALTRLTEEGLVTWSEQIQEGRPDKKVYSITPAGRDALEDALRALPVEDKFRSEFLFFMSFCELMDTDHIARLIDNRINEVHSRQVFLDEADHEDTNVGHQFVLGYGRAMLEASLKYLRENRALVENPSVDHAPADHVSAKQTNGSTPVSPNQDQWK